MTTAEGTSLSPPPPWRLVAELPVGGLHSIGFVAGTRDLLIVSQQGRGIHDSNSGKRLARDRDESWTWYDTSGPTAVGIGPYAGQRILVAGVDGGGLLVTTKDGWALTTDSASVYLGKDGSMVAFSPRWRGEEVRAYGFSEDGESLAVAVGSHTVEVYSRATVQERAGEQ